MFDLSAIRAMIANPRPTMTSTEAHWYNVAVALLGEIDRLRVVGCYPLPRNDGAQAVVLTAPKVPPTLDLPPAPDGMRWGKMAFTHLFHLVATHRGEHQRWCARTSVFRDLRFNITVSSRVCPECLAVAKKNEAGLHPRVVL